jgi:ankyrin repeat protein
MRKLSAKSSLDTLRKEAKHWLGEIRAGYVDACARFARVHSRSPTMAGLRDVQHALAREHGLSNWNDLKRALADLKPDTRGFDQQHAEFLEYACLRYGIRPGTTTWDRMYNDHPTHPRHAAGLLSRNPAIAKASIHAAVVSGDLAEVERRLAQHPACANEKCPHAWEPLLYLCFGRLPIDAARDNAVAIAKALLAAGANPHVTFGTGAPFTALTGVIGEGEGTRYGQPPHPRARDLAALLIDSGLDPYDAQALYNTSLEDDDVSWLDFLYDWSLALGRTDEWQQPSASWPNKRMLDYLLGNAISRNHLRRASWLLGHGARAAALDYYTKQPMIRNALLNGFVAMAELLEQRGAKREALDGHDAFQAACMRLDQAAASTLSQRHPEFLQRGDTLLRAASLDRTDVVLLLLDLGVSPDVEEDVHKTRPLHAAAANNAMNVAKLLIERGAAIDPIDGKYRSTPLGWAHYLEKAGIRELLANFSRDVLALVAMGNVERLRHVLSDNAPRPELHEIPLFNLPDDDDVAAEVAGVLLEHGADPRAKDKDGTTAIEYNQRRGLAQTVETLKGMNATHSSNLNR